MMQTVNIITFSPTIRLLDCDSELKVAIYAFSLEYGLVASMLHQYFFPVPYETRDTNLFHLLLKSGALALTFLAWIFHYGSCAAASIANHIFLK